MFATEKEFYLIIYMYARLHPFCIRYRHFYVFSIGGGSALLPAPVPPVTLQEKQDVTRRLAAAGATIQELNKVRRALSLLKGGGLARSAYPAQVQLSNCLHSSNVVDMFDLLLHGPKSIKYPPHGTAAIRKSDAKSVFFFFSK